MPLRPCDKACVIALHLSDSKQTTRVFNLTGVDLHLADFNHSVLNSLRHQLEAVHAINSKGIFFTKLPRCHTVSCCYGKIQSHSVPPLYPLFLRDSCCRQKHLFSKLQDPRRLSSLMEQQRCTELID
ncbi:hypothetical protein ILYODFUR_013346 [Ilyodon furcidens]|uniref:Uncharacterized protein n=1 Tax=Ilyodon furcidens TaxID=33524 RepID=A0ABV0TB22_9TELE